MKEVKFKKIKKIKKGGKDFSRVRYGLSKTTIRTSRPLETNSRPSRFPEYATSYWYIGRKIQKEEKQNGI